MEQSVFIRIETIFKLIMSMAGTRTIGSNKSFLQYTKRIDYDYY